FQGWWRQEGLLSSIPEIKGWISPRLKIRFELRGDELEIYGLDGQKFLSSIELSQKAQRLAEYIRSLGIDPDTL
ncbi:MAG: Uma2 family endonuclease, partial [Microcystis sp. LE19-12.2C]|nr:Uma2 family endonuclease [Microcystis sp. LE19-12.2C]